MSEKYQITYFPYLFMSRYDSIEFDKVFIWNFDQQNTERIKDVDFRKYIAKLVSANQILQWLHEIMQHSGKAYIPVTKQSGILTGGGTVGASQVFEDSQFLEYVGSATWVRTIIF